MWHRTTRAPKSTRFTCRRPILPSPVQETMSRWRSVGAPRGERHFAYLRGHRLKLDLIALPRPTLRNRPHRQFHNRMRHQTKRRPPRRHIPHDLPHHILLIDINQIQRKFHEERVDALTRHNPQPFPRPQLCVLQKPGSPLRTGIRDINRLAQHSPPRDVAKPVFHAQPYSTR